MEANQVSMESILDMESMDRPLPQDHALFKTKGLEFSCVTTCMDPEDITPSARYRKANTTQPLFHMESKKF